MDIIYKRMYTQLKKFLNYLVFLSDNAWYKNIYKYSTYLSFLLILVTYTGLIYVNPTYLTIVHNFLLYYVCGILLLRFNPFITQHTSASSVEFNRGIAFTAGLILLTTTVAKTVSEQVLT